MTDIEDIADRTAARHRAGLPVGRGDARRGDRMPARPHRQGQGRQHLHHRDGGAGAGRGRARRRRATGAASRCRRSTACRSAGRIFSTSPARRPRPARNCSRGEPAKTADLACVANAAAAGMVAIGKLNMTELAYSGIGLNPHFGTPLNPNDRATPRSPGGSSSGCGAAVAGAAGALRRRFRHRRVGAHSGRLQRRRRLQDQHRPHRRDRAGAAGAELRHDRPAGALGRGLHPARHGDARRGHDAGAPRRSQIADACLRRKTWCSTRRSRR